VALVCSEPAKLCVTYGETRAPSHRAYERSGPDDYWDEWYTPASTRWLLSKPIHEATRIVNSDLRKVGKSFLRKYS
jgi:hypothetical protein